MEIDLIDYTGYSPLVKDNFGHAAVDKLLYTKYTRLEQGEDRWVKINNMTQEEKLQELEYMAGTIPSSWEFVNYTFDIQGVTRAFTHQFVRTRTGSYAQQTMRMLNVEGFEYLNDVDESFPDSQGIYNAAMQDINKAYGAMIRAGVPIEQARGILPTNIHTNIIAQFNLRTLCEMAKSRTSGRVQSEFRQVFKKMTDCVIEVHPWTEMFLFPDRDKMLIDLESIIQDLSNAGENPTQAQANDAMKIIDKLKKEGG